jgi:hypothetical protein
VTLPGTPVLSEPDTIAEALEIPDSLAALADGTEALVATPPLADTSAGVRQEVPAFPWGWLLLGLVVGALVGAAVMGGVASRRLQRQRELFANPPGAAYPSADDPNLY